MAEKNIKIEGGKKKKLFLENLGFIKIIARKYRNDKDNLTELDLFCEGEIALVDAVNLIDHKDSYNFSVLAVLMIRKAVLKSINAKRAIFHGIVKKPPSVDFIDNGVLFDYFDLTRNVWTLETRPLFSEEEKQKIMSEIKNDVKNNISELIEFISEILKISKSEAEGELRKFI